MKICKKRQCYKLIFSAVLSKFTSFKTNNAFFHGVSLRIISDISKNNLKVTKNVLFISKHKSFLSQSFMNLQRK